MTIRIIVTIIIYLLFSKWIGNKIAGRFGWLIPATRQYPKTTAYVALGILFLFLFTIWILDPEMLKPS